MADVSGSDTDEAADEEADDKDDDSHVSGVLRDDYYKNWVKGAEGLVILQKGLAPFVDREIYNRHALFLNKLPPPCVQGTNGCGCTFQNVLPNHAINLCHLRNCLCKGRGRRKCPNQGYCSTFCQLILNEHRTGNPMWKNSDINAWPSDHWSIGKCYQTTPTPSNSAQTTDASGLLSIIINGKFFQTKVTSQLGQPGDFFLKARNLRNDILHRAKMELTDAELQDILDTFVVVLKDSASLLHDRDAILAVKNLELLKTDQLKITSEEETEILYQRKEALKQMIQEETVKGMLRVEKVGSKAEESIDAKGKQMIENGSKAEESIDAKGKQVMDELRKLRDETMRKVKKARSGSVKYDAAAFQRQINELRVRLRNTEEKIKACKVGGSNSGEGVHNTKQETLDQKLQDIRRLLANHLRKHYTTTSLSPLKTKENDINIDEIYTEPNMEIEEKTAEQDKDNGSNKRSVKQYRDIIETKGIRLKRIYVVGEVGTGKTAFCQMLISNWCKFILKDSPDDSEMMQMIKQFDFVFYLPLRSLQTNSNLKEMIQCYYKNEVAKETVDYILSELPEKCLILADGLDEWKPSYGAERPVHVTDGIPDAEDMKDVTLITTSRPSAIGVLNMKSTEYDKKIILSGIKRISVDTMAQRYCAKATNKEDVLKGLKNLEVTDIENMPLVLKQIVWMLRKGFKIAPGISGLYSDIAKIAVKWAYDKYKQEISHFKLNRRFAKFSLPEQLSKAPFIKECQNLVLSLSEIAFEMLTTDSGNAFGRCKLSKYGIDDGQLKALLSVGLLSEDNFDNPLEEDTQFCFPHTSFTEYFSAVFIASHVESRRTSTDAAENHPDSTNFLTKFFKNRRSIEDILSIEIMLKFVCGLAPDLMQCVCQNIYSIAQSCEEFSTERERFFCMGDCVALLKVLRVQRLIAKCVTECKKSSSSVTLHLSICDLFVLDESYLKIHEHIEGQRVQHLFADNGSNSDKRDSAFSVDCSKFKHLKTLYINNKDLVFFSSPINLQNLQIKGLERIFCEKKLIPELLKGEPCKTLQVIFLHFIYLRYHSEVLGLINIIARTTTLRVIKILLLKCSECDRQCRHVMDLSQHDKLQTLTLSASPAIFVKVINKSSLETVCLNQLYSECVRALRDSPKLNNLTTAFYSGSRTVFTKEMHEDVCTCTQLQHLTLRSVDIQDDALQLNSCLENLSHIELHYVSIRVPTFIKFVESLLTLRQSVTVLVWLSPDCKSEPCKYKSYIQNNPEKFKSLPLTRSDTTIQLFRKKILICSDEVVFKFETLINKLSVV